MVSRQWVRAAAAALWCSAFAAQAASEPLGDAFRLNPDEAPAPFSSTAEVIRAPGGAFAATWVQSRNYTEGTLQLVRRYDASGAPLAAPLRVTQQWDRGDAGVVAGDRDGNFVVVWSYEDGVPPEQAISRGVWGRRFDAAGNPLGDEFQIAPAPVSTSGFLGVSMEADGRFVAVWLGESTNPGLFGRVYDRAGLPRTAALRLVQLSGHLERPQALMREDGSFVLAYSCNDTCGGRGDLFTGFLEGFDADGQPLFPRRQIGVEVGFVDLQAVPAGGFQAVWTQPDHTTLQRHLYLRRFDDEGRSAAAPVLIESAANFHKITAGSDRRGAATIAWQSGSGELFARNVDVDGALDGGRYPIGPAAHSYPDIAVSHDEAGTMLLTLTCEADGNTTVCGRFYGELPAPPELPRVEPPLGNNEVGGALGVSAITLLLLGGATALRRRRPTGAGRTSGSPARC